MFRAYDLHTCNDVMSVHREATNASQLTILLATHHNRTRQEDTSGDTEHDCIGTLHVHLKQVLEAYSSAAITINAAVSFWRLTTPPGTGHRLHVPFVGLTA